MCDVSCECDEPVSLRLCGHHACDSHTDEASDLCLYCVPVDELDYVMCVQMAELGRTVGYAQRVD